MRHEIRLFEVVGVFRLSPIPVPGSAALRFKIEILRAVADGRFHARVYRNDAFRIQPTFPQNRGVPAQDPSDEMVEVEDLDDWNANQFATRQEALDHVLARLSEMFSQYDFR